ncbi:MAG: hypothetical protein PHV02_20225, partial [Rhodocyclaceae bacterium]|nr:hypothetical protein [Rhodocyclaceae bacterium]
MPVDRQLGINKGLISHSESNIKQLSADANYPRNRSYPLEIRRQPKQDKHLTAISGVTQWVKQNAETSIAKNP